MKKLLLLLVFIIPLSGCVPTALVLGATAGGSVLYSNISVKTMMQDQHITQTAENMLSQSPELQNKINISVATYNGIVLMVGQAKSPQAKRYAFDLVASLKNYQGTNHIKRIFDEVKIAKQESFWDETKDAWITSKVKASLLATRRVPSRDIKVLTEEGVVYLMGKLSTQQAGLAANVTRRVSGVKKVVKVFQYV